MMPLVVGAVLAIAALAWVMAPLVAPRAILLVDDASPEPDHADAERRELALDVAAGRLSREEFERLAGEPPPRA